MDREALKRRVEDALIPHWFIAPGQRDWTAGQRALIFDVTIDTVLEAACDAIDAQQLPYRPHGDEAKIEAWMACEDEAKKTLRALKEG